MSHEVYAIKGHPDLWLDESYVDNSAFIRTTEAIDRDFNADWRKYVKAEITLGNAEKAMFKTQFEKDGDKFHCIQCGERIATRAAALNHMRHQKYEICPNGKTFLSRISEGT